MPTIEQTFSAGQTVVFPGGEQFHILTANDPVDVTFYGANKKPIETWEQMKAGFRIRYREAPLAIEIHSATAQTIKIAITSGDGVYSRSQGDVNVLDIAGGTIDQVTNLVGGTIDQIKKSIADYQRSYSDQKTFLWANARVAGAGNYPRVGIGNPVGSGVLVAIFNCIITWNNNNTTIQFRKDSSVPSGSAASNKYLNQGTSQAVGWVDEVASLTGTNMGNLMVFSSTGEIVVPFQDAIIVPEGYSFYITANNAGYGISAVFNWYEF